MAKVFQSFEVTWNDGKPISLPAELVVQHEDRYFLKMRASHHKLLQLLCGNPEKNSSLSQSELLKQLKEKRDATVEAILKGQGEDPPSEEAMGMKSKAANKNTKKMQDDMIVDIDISGSTVSVLVPKLRYKLCDFQVELVAEQLTTVFQFLEKKDWASLKAPEKAPRKRKAAEAQPPLRADT